MSEENKDQQEQQSVPKQEEKRFESGERKFPTAQLIKQALEAKSEGKDFDPQKAREELKKTSEKPKEEEIDIESLSKIDDTTEESASNENDDSPDDNEQKNELEEDDDSDYKPTEWEQVSPDDFINKDGSNLKDRTKITVSDAFKGIKKKLTDVNKKYSKLLKKAGPLEQENSQLKKELDEVKKWRDERYFEESPDFKESFITPAVEAEKKIVGYISSIGIESGSREESEARRGLALLNKYAQEGDETKYTMQVDSLLEVFPTSPTLRAKFTNATDDYFNRVQKRDNALKNKEEARKEILKKDAETIQGSRTVVQEVIAAQLSEYERNNKQFVDFFRSDSAKDFFKYDDTIASGKQKAADLLSEMTANRKPSKELISLVTRGILAEISEKEKKALAKQSADLQTQNDNLKKELEETKAVIAKLKPSSSRPSTTKSGDTKKSFSQRLAEHYSR